MLRDDRCKKFGNYNKIVEIDESKSGKMKWGSEEMRGMRKLADASSLHEYLEILKEDWKFVSLRMIYDQKKTFVVRDWILPSTKIILDYCAAYKCFKEKRFQHLTINHNLYFVDPGIGAHTNTAEEIWSAIKSYA